MGLTLCAKNLQGMCIHPHVHFCQGFDSRIRNDFQPDAEEHVKELYDRHLADGIPRWDRPGGDGGQWMETWVHKTCDSISVTKIGLCMIEGIYGRNGNAFMFGPGPGGRAEDFMTNIIIFGKNPFNVDIIGHWFGGHEPGNFGLFHIAKERGLSNTINPMAIPVYLWENGVPELTPLRDFERTPLKTPYLQRNYGGQNEQQYHMVDEPYEYGPSTAVESIGENKPETYTREKPRTDIIGQNFPNPFNGSTTIEYQLPRDGHVTLEIHDSSGQRIDVLVNEWRKKGVHMASWDAGKRPSGVYFYLFRTDGFEKIRKMILVR